jgi:hypothetical protein
MTDELQQPTAPEAAQTEQQTADQGSTELTINDLNLMKQIIDMASARGAFKPNEMMAVGQTYTKLTTFLDAVAKQQAAAPAGA